MIEVDIVNLGLTIYLPDDLSGDQLAGAIAARFPGGRPPVERRGRSRASIVEPYVPGDETEEPITSRFTCEVHPDDHGDRVAPEKRPAFGIRYGLAEDLEATLDAASKAAGGSSSGFLQSCSRRARRWAMIRVTDEVMLYGAMPMFIRRAMVWGASLV